MEYFVLVAKAVVSGFIVAVPMGAVAALCIRRALQGRWMTGIVIGIGGALADAILAAGAALGLSLILSYVMSHIELLRYAGGGALIILGIFMYRADPPALDQDPARRRSPTSIANIANLAAAMASGFALTIFNPATFLAFVATFTALNIFDGTPPDVTKGSLLVGGVFVGSTLWWLILGLGATLLSARLSDRMFVLIDKALALFIIAVGVVAIARPL